MNLNLKKKKQQKNNNNNNNNTRMKVFEMNQTTKSLIAGGKITL